MDTKPLVFLGVGGFLAYLLSRSRMTPGSTGVVVPQAGGPAIVPAVESGVPTDGMSPSEKARLCKDVPYSRFGDILVRGANEQSQMPRGFKECFLDVGANIPLSAITQKDMNLATALLGGNLDRYGEAYTPRTLAILKNEADLAAGKTITQLFQTVLSFVPVLGQVMKAALDVGIKDIDAAMIKERAKLSASQKGVKIVIDIKNASETTVMILGNPSTDTLYLHVANAYQAFHFDDSGHYVADNVSAGLAYTNIRQGMLKEYLGSARDSDIYEPDTSLPHCRLFTETRSGYVLPWLSLELGASGVPPAYQRDWQSQFSTPAEGSFDPNERASTVPWEEAVYRRAVCLRIFDLMIGQFFPPIHPAAAGATASLQSGVLGKWATYGGRFPWEGRRWSYHNPIYGDVWESVYPPYPGEDTNIVLSDGTRLDYYGAPVAPGYNLSVITHAEGGALDLAAAKLDAATAAANSYGQPLEDLSATPGVVQPSSAPVIPNPTLAALTLSPTVVATPAPSVATVATPTVTTRTATSPTSSTSISTVRSRYSLYG